MPMLVPFSAPALAQGPAYGQAVYTTTVTPRTGEDLRSPCQYELTIPQPAVAARAVWVIFDRGREVTALYNDPEVFRFADKQRLALLLARHCASTEREDMNVDPSKGIGRALFTALDQLAQASKHGELETAKIIAFGFSGAGSLVARLPGFAPDRVLAAIPYAPGQYEPLGMDTIELSPAAAAIPQLIIANGADTVNGTRRPLDYFTRYFEKGAPWTFAIQNGVPHHGALANARPLMFAWIEGVLDSPAAWSLYMRNAPADVLDEWKSPVLRITGARIEKPGASPPGNYVPAGRAPSRKAANEWLSFVRKPQHPVNSKYP
jgi:dienelactone hydrolase